MRHLPLDCFVVGYRLEHGGLMLYAGADGDMAFYMDPSLASAKADWLNIYRSSELPDAKAKWQVYKMSFKRYEEVKL